MQTRLCPIIGLTCYESACSAGCQKAPTDAEARRSAQLETNTIALKALTGAVLELAEAMRGVGVHLNVLYNLIKSRIG